MLHELLKTLRAGLRLSQAEVARRADISSSYLCMLEKGQGTPSLKTLRALAHALGVAPSIFLPDEVVVARVPTNSTHSPTTPTRGRRRTPHGDSPD